MILGVICVHQVETLPWIAVLVLRDHKGSCMIIDNCLLQILFLEVHLHVFIKGNEPKDSVLETHIQESTCRYYPDIYIKYWIIHIWESYCLRFIVKLTYTTSLCCRVEKINLIPERPNVYSALNHGSSLRGFELVTLSQPNLVHRVVLVIDK